MNKTRQNIYTVSFAILLGLTCATLLTAAAEFTRPQQAANKKAEEIRNVLTALKVPFDAQADAGDLISIFERDVVEQSPAEGLTLYRYQPGGTDALIAVAVRFIGPGLWGPIKGFLALEPDFKTIRGVTFYEQEETPGLGGEIAAEPFRRQFEGRQIADTEGRWGIEIASGGGETAPINRIAAISGATMTCDKVEEMINLVIRQLAETREADGR